MSVNQLDFEISRYRSAVRALDKLPSGDVRAKIQAILILIHKEIVAIDGIIDSGKTERLYEKYEKINKHYNQIEHEKANK